MTAIRIGVAVICIAFPTVAAVSWIGSAEERLAAEERADHEQPEEQGAAIAAAANEEYCTVELKRILRRVLKSCGLIGQQSGAASRGCQPVDAKTVATMSGEDFNALFLPMKDRGGIVQFDQGDATLDDGDRALIDRFFADQRGASYFFIVARASPEGTVEVNRKLSQDRAESLMSHLRERFADPDLERQVGLLWLGEEFAQLDDSFCDWERSGDSGSCKPEEINRSAFVAWIDCRL